jgi:hypothetical protein
MMKLSHLLLSVLLLLHCNNGDAQTPYGIWAKTFTPTSGLSVTLSAGVLDKKGSIYTTGYFFGAVDFDPSSSAGYFAGSGMANLFVCKFTANGDFVWAKTIGSNTVSARDIEVDGSGNVYITGYYYGVVDFDPGADSAMLSSAGRSDAFILKLNSNGDFIWGKGWGSANNDDLVSCISLDWNANVYATGPFEGTVDFNPDTAATAFSNLTAAGLEDIFISKLDSSGNFIWAKRMGGSDKDYSTNLAISETGSIYTTGHFLSNDADFDPSTGVAPLAAKKDDIFISKLDADGNHVWVKSFSGPSTYPNTGHPAAIALDAHGNVYTAGAFKDTIDFDPSSAGVMKLGAQAVGGFDAYVSKLDSNGSYLWAKAIGGSSGQVSIGALAIKGSNVYATGSFEGAIYFDPTSTRASTSRGNSDIFVYKIESSGAYLWSGTAGGNGIDGGVALAVDDSNYVYSFGDFWGNGDFDPGGGTITLQGNGAIFKWGETAATGISASAFSNTTSVTVQPQPASDIISIRCSDPTLRGKAAMIYTAQGILVARLTLAAVTYVDISSWAAGIYVLSLPKGQALKLVKQ